MTKNFDYSQEDLIEGLKKIGIGNGDIVFTHVGFGFLGRAKNCNTNDEISKMIVDSFHHVLGDNGTMLVPTYTYSFCNNQVFDVHNSLSTIGPFTEYFRKIDGVIRSCDPIFSVSGFGPKTKKLLTNLPNTCFGIDSIYHRLVKNNAKICMVGLGLQWATFRHHIEEMARVPFRYVKQFSGHIKEHDTIKTETWNYFVRILSDNCYPDGRRLEEKAKETGLCKVISIGRGQICSIIAQEFFNLGMSELKKDPWFTARGPPLNSVELKKARLCSG